MKKEMPNRRLPASRAPFFSSSAQNLDDDGLHDACKNGTAFGKWWFDFVKSQNMTLPPNSTEHQRVVSKLYDALNDRNASPYVDSITQLFNLYAFLNDHGFCGESWCDFSGVYLDTTAASFTRLNASSVSFFRTMYYPNILCVVGTSASDDNVSYPYTNFTNGVYQNTLFDTLTFTTNFTGSDITGLKITNSVMWLGLIARDTCLDHVLISNSNGVIDITNSVGANITMACSNLGLTATNATLDTVDFSNSDLSFSNFSHAQITNANFQCAGISYSQWGPPNINWLVFNPIDTTGACLAASTDLPQICQATCNETFCNSTELEYCTPQRPIPMARALAASSLAVPLNGWCISAQDMNNNCFPKNPFPVSSCPNSLIPPVKGEVDMALLLGLLLGFGALALVLLVVFRKSIFKACQKNTQSDDDEKQPLRVNII